MTGFGPVRSIPRTAQRPATYRFDLRRPGPEIVPLGPHRDLPSALAKVPGQLDIELSRRGVYCRFGGLTQTDETGHCFQFSITFMSLPLSGCPAEKVDQVMSVVNDVLSESVPGFTITTVAAPLFTGQELSAAEACVPSTCMDGLRVTLEFGRLAAR